ncbi:MAG: dTMP kinase [Rickettsiales bacterium]
MSSGKFISFEGGEGSGKSTQLGLLAGKLNKTKLPFIMTREPGGSKGAEEIRSLLVSGDDRNWEPLAETLLFQAARCDHIDKVIKPNLLEGKTVICDRFVDSTLVYQGIGKSLGKNYIKSLHNMLFGNFMPDLTIILDINPKEGLRRAKGRGDGEDRFERLAIEFHNKIRDGFLEIAVREPQRCVVLDATKKIDELHNIVISIIKERCGIML